MRYLILAMFVASAAVAFYLSGSRDAAGQSCIAPEDVAVPIAHDITGDEAARFLEAFNAMPPATDIPGERVMLTEPAPNGRSTVLIFYRGCLLSGSWWLTQDAVDHLLWLALGQGT